MSETHLTLRYAVLSGFSRYRFTSEGHGERYAKGAWHPLGAFPGNKGYLRVEMTDDAGQRRKIRLHRAVKWAFDGIGELPKGDGSGRLEVRHLNDNKLDNRLENLAFGTRAENQRDAILNGKLTWGDRNPRSKYSEAMILEAVTRCRHGEKRSIVACESGIRPQTLDSILKGRSWKHLGVRGRLRALAPGWETKFSPPLSREILSWQDDGGR